MLAAVALPLSGPFAFLAACYACPFQVGCLAMTAMLG